MLPDRQIWPSCVFPFGIPFTAQPICGLDVCVADAVNVCRAPGMRTALAGLMLTEMLLVSCSVTEALRPGFAVLAEIVTCRAAGIFTGARYRPFCDAEFEMVPNSVFPPGILFTLHVSGCEGVPLKVAVKACVCSRATVAFAGAMASARAATTCVVTLAVFVGSARLAAVSVTCGGCGGAGGAVYSPALDTLPHILAAAPHPLPLTLQLTPVARFDPGTGWIAAVN